MNRALVAILLLLAALPARAQFQPAWDRGTAKHPKLGNVEFAVMRRLHETPVGSDKVYSRAYLSCQRDQGTLALELANTSSPTDTGGLQPASNPRVSCARKAATGPAQEIAAKWEFNKIGDALARGFKPATWRECRVVTVTQEVALGPGWSAKTAKVEFDIDATSAELDPLFEACGYGAKVASAPAGTVAAETVATPEMMPSMPSTPPAPAAAPPAATAPVQQPANASPAPVAKAASDGPWKPARTITVGKSNVRSGPSIDTPIVMQLHPGSVIQVQAVGTGWWRVRGTNGTPYGFIREDRLSFR